MHGFLSVFVVTDQNVIEFQIIVSQTTLMDAFVDVDQPDTELVNRFVRERHVELVEVRVQVPPVFRHHIIRHELFSILNTFCYQPLANV